MDESHKYIEKKIGVFHLGTSHIAIEAMNDVDILEILDLKNIEKLKYQEGFELYWNYLKNINYEKRYFFKILLSEKIQNWNFLYFETWDYEKCKEIVVKLISRNPNRVNFYFADSCVDGYSWILANNGKIFREFDYTMSVLHKSKGDYATKEEEDFIKNINSDYFVFGEDVWLSVIRATSDIPIDTYFENQNIFIGEIEK